MSGTSRCCGRQPMTRTSSPRSSSAGSKSGLTLIFVDGNHDVHPKPRALPLNTEGFGVIGDRLLYAPRGHRWELEGVRFGALDGAYSLDRRTPEAGESVVRGGGDRLPSAGIR